MKEIQENIGIKEQLSNFEQRIDNYRATLNAGGVWLFLATLGCWGVDDLTIKMIAAVFTFIIFTHGLFKGSKNLKRLFSSDVKKYKDIINTSDMLEDQKKARLYDLKILEEKKLSFFSALKDNPSYYLGIIFLGASFWHWYGFAILKLIN